MKQQQKVPLVHFAMRIFLSTFQKCLSAVYPPAQSQMWTPEMSTVEVSNISEVYMF